ncbi:hypothetical protein [Halalkalibacterium ligniniphilum]|uniref:hypothetical protein n=1 Tax=Halalkalibacterium ligniniphilum TaxID=1134413 RepID=UPI00034A7EFF|nr:hypothetical protein [Halalkalibacterium ligniniphilum]
MLIGFSLLTSVSRFVLQVDDFFPTYFDHFLILQSSILFEPIEKTMEREGIEETGVHAKAKEVIALRDLPTAIHNLYIVVSME